MRNPADVDSRSITKPASKVMLGGILSLVGSLASNVIVAYLYGAGANMDAYLTALVIPTYFQIVLFWNLSFVLIPAFIEAEEKQKKEDAWALVGSFCWLTVLVLLVIALMGSFFADAIIGATAPGFEGEKAALAARMFQVLIFSTPFTGLSTLTVGIQNARNRFFWPSFAPAVGSFANVLVLVLFSRTLGSMALCWGYFAATFFQALFTLVPVLSRAWNKALPIGDPRVTGILRLVTPLIVFGLFTSFAPIVERYFSSGLPDGQIAYMGYANKISNIFVLLLASSIATVILPSMARSYATDGIAGLSERNNFGLRLTFALALPAVLILSAIAVPLIKVLFERGAFGLTATLGVSRVIFAYLLSDVLFRMIGNILQRSFYVLKDTITQSVIGSVLLILYLLVARFFVVNWGYVGLVWAGALRHGLSIVILWSILLLRFPKDHLEQTFLLILKYAVAAVGAYACGYFILLGIQSLPPLVQLIVAGTLSVGVYAGMLYLLDKAMFLSILEVFGVRSILNKAQMMGIPLLHAWSTRSERERP